MAYRTSRGVNDLVLLDDLSNEGIFHCLSSHYNGDEIYTYIGQVLISVNPFKDISGLYSSPNKYKNKSSHQNSPHIFALAERAYRSMVQDLSRECVIITGESGAGKTEAAKKVLEYVAAISSKSSEVQKVKSQLLECNPLLESFGNAATLRNYNSSRFGKYQEISFDVEDPCGGKINTYLLEKNRVIERQVGERSFHIFYQLLFGSSSTERQHCGFGNMKPEDFGYLNQSKCYTVPDMKDSNEFSHTKKAMEVIGIEEGERISIFQLLAVILFLGNVNFQGRRGSVGVTLDPSRASTPLHYVSHFLGIPIASLSENLTHKRIKTTSEAFMSPLTFEECTFARDSLAKGIYARLFQYIVARANQSINTEFFTNSLGILDIYGFEIFGTNSFEQLCINYVNEKLHQLFTSVTIEQEQKIYREEGIKWQTIQYFNNLPIVDMIENRQGGLFALMAEESIFPKATDDTLYDKLVSHFRSHQHFAVGNSSSGRTFLIKHYAGRVEYSPYSMLDKNKDLLYPNIIDLVGNCENTLILQLFEADVARLKDDKKRPISTCIQFKADVQKLMEALEACHQHYCRCIKPNELKRSGMIEKDRVMEQIIYLGLLENIKVRKAGFATRINYYKFLAKYKCVSSVHIEYKDDPRKSVEKIMVELGIKDYECGRTKIFIKSPKSLFQLEDLRSAFLATAATHMPQTKMPDGSFDQFIWADKVLSYDIKENRGDGRQVNQNPAKLYYELILSTNFCYLYDIKNSSVIKIPMTTLGGISIGGNSTDGFMVLHCQDRDRNGTVTKTYDYLLEDIFKGEILLVTDVLKSYGVEFDIRRTDVVPRCTDGNFVPLKGTKLKNLKGRCIIM